MLDRELDLLKGVVRAKEPLRVPVVLSREEEAGLLSKLDGTAWLMASLMYGSGLRLMECCRIRVKDVDLGRKKITVRDGKGRKDRVTVLPASLVDPLAQQLARVRRQHERDVAQGAGYVELPFALARKYPRAARDWIWQWVFPATRIYLDRDTGHRRRHHLDESVVQRAVREAARAAGLPKHVTCHTLRHYAGPGISATASPPICWRAATTSGPSRTSSATRTSARR